MKKFWLIIMLAATLLCGCGTGSFRAVDFSNATSLPVEEISEFPTFQMESAGAEMSMSSCFSVPSGLFWEDWENRTGDNGDYTAHWMMFTEYETGSSYPLCTRTNCTHDSNECSAYTTDGHSAVYCDGEWLYYTDTFGASLWKMRSDGSERQEVFALGQDSNVQSVALISTPVYYKDKVYFTSHCTYLDEESGKLKTERRICVCDLSTGKVSLVPYEFGGVVNSTDIQILGLYKNELFLRYIKREGIALNQYHETFFLLNLDNNEVTLLYQYTWDGDSEADITVRWETDPEQGVVMFQLCDTDSRVNPYDNTGETAAIWEGERYWFDLEARKGYCLKNQTISSDEHMIDGKLVFHVWNEEHTQIRRMIWDLKTGELADHPADMANIALSNIPGDSGEYYFFEEYQPEEQAIQCGLIRKTDFWNGQRTLILFPEWKLG